MRTLIFIFIGLLSSFCNAKTPLKENYTKLCQKISSMTQEQRITFFNQNTPAMGKFWNNPMQSEFVFDYEGFHYIASHQNDNFRSINLIAFIEANDKIYNLCTFERNKVIELEYVDASTSKEFCNAASKADPIELNIDPNITDSPPFNYRETVVTKVAKIDYNNDGVKENILGLNLFSGAGSGCDNYYYVLLENDLNTLVPSNSSLLQSACGYKTHFVSVNGKVALVSESEYGEIPRYITIQNGAAVKKICVYKDMASLSLKHVYDIGHDDMQINGYSKNQDYMTNAFLREYHKAIEQ